MKRRPISRGEMISTLCFAGIGVWLFGTALDAQPLKSIALHFCALTCFAAAARHPISRLFEIFQDK